MIDILVNYEYWFYIILFFTIFCETGILIGAFLPGDTLLFAAGALSAREPELLNIHVLFISLSIAKVAGNSVNYFLGRWLGPKVFRSNESWIFHKKNIQKANHFYKRYGGKVIIFASFIPIIRTFAPFVAGIAKMSLIKFLFYNAIGALIWMGILLYGSYFFDRIPFVRQHFSLVILVTILIFILPSLIAFFQKFFSFRFLRKK